MKTAPDCLIAGCEILWDCFPDGNRLGGATCNVGYHLNQLGMKPGLIASVGRDALGKEALRVIEHEWHCDTQWIACRDDVPTGRVNVTLQAHGEPTYEVLAPAAWDFVEIPSAALADRTCPLLYPSVALRSEFNRTQIRRALVGYRGLKCFDANLRPPHNSPATVLEFAKLADFVKVNDSELKLLGEAAGSKETELEALLRDFARLIGVNRICVTRAEHAALMLYDGGLFYGQTFPTVVKDTVGAGDAFLASMIASLCQPGFDPETALSRASALGSWLASKAGAQPKYDDTVSAQFCGGRYQWDFQ
jgi:fructokinase